MRRHSNTAPSLERRPRRADDRWDWGLGAATVAVLLALTQMGSARAETRAHNVVADREGGRLFIDGLEFKAGRSSDQQVYVEINGTPLLVDTATATNDYLVAELRLEQLRLTRAVEDQSRLMQTRLQQLEAARPQAMRTVFAAP